MDDHSAQTRDLLQRAQRGEVQALHDLLAHYRDRLRRMVDLRLDRRLQGRVDASDVIQEGYLDVARRFEEYLRAPKLPFLLWLRLVVGERLLILHRRHLGTQMRDAGREVSLFQGALPAATSAALAAHLLGRHTSPSHAAVRAERLLRVQEALNSLDPLDREILALRHFEELTCAEAALALDISEAAAAKRYIRALKRLKEVLTTVLKSPEDL